MRTIEVSELEAKCLKLLDEVIETGEPIVITRDGKPLAQLAPVPPARKSILGLHKGQVEILGDIIEPIDVEWEANQ